TPAWLALYFACAWLGAIASRSTPARFRSAEIADIIGRSGATRLLAVRSAAEPFPSLRSCFFAAFNPTMAKIAAEAGTGRKSERALRHERGAGTLCPAAPRGAALAQRA